MKEITKHSGKRSNGLAGTGSFLHVGKWSQGHVLDQMAQNGPPGNTPKKGSLLRKRPKEDERVAQGGFHERVTESPRSHGHFVLSGPIVSFFV